MTRIFSKSTNALIAIVFVCFILLTNSIFSQESQQQELSVSQDETETTNRISGGTPAAEGAYSHSASIVFRANRRQYCSGTLINATMIMTAAHCLFTGSRLDDPSWSGVAIGFKTISENGRVNVPLRSIRRMWVHPSYVPNDISRNTNDIAILELSTAVQETPALILDSQREYLPYEEPGTTLSVAGWGSTPQSSSSDELLETDISIFHPSDCRSLLAAGGYNTDTMVCGTGQSIRDACQGDSGAAAGVQTDEGFVAVGIVSFGRGECGSNSLGAYTRVSAYIQFIDSVMSGLLQADSQSSGANSIQFSAGALFIVATMIVTMLF